MSTGQIEVNVKEQQMLDLTGPLPMKPPGKNPYENKKFKEHCDLMMSLAHQLQAEAAKYPLDRQLRFNKLMGKYEILYMHMPGMFMAALMGDLHKGQIGQIVAAYCQPGSDSKEKIDGIHGCLDEFVKPGLQKMEELKATQNELKQQAERKSNSLTEEVLKMYI
jgi:hypothetical protein